MVVKHTFAVRRLGSASDTPAHHLRSVIDIEELRQAIRLNSVQLMQQRCKDTPEIARYYYKNKFHTVGPLSTADRLTKALLEDGMERKYGGTVEGLATAAANHVRTGNATDAERQFTESNLCWNTFRSTASTLSHKATQQNELREFRAKLSAKLAKRGTKPKDEEQPSESAAVDDDLDNVVSTLAADGVDNSVVSQNGKGGRG